MVRPINLQGHIRNKGRIHGHVSQHLPGIYPKATQDNSYIHSTYRGFRADYNQLTAQISIESQLYQNVDTLYKSNLDRIQNLRATGRRYKTALFGCKSEDEDIEQAPPIYMFLHQNQLIKELQNLQSQLSWSILQDKSTEAGRLNAIYLRAKNHSTDSNDILKKRTAFYKSWSKQWTDAINNVLDTLGTSEYRNQFNDLAQLLENFKANLQQDGTALFVDSKNGIKPGEVLSKLGFQWEAIAAWFLGGAVLEVADPTRVKTNIQQIGKKEGLGDISLGHILYEDTVPLDMQFEGTMSLKFRANENFSIQAQVNPAQIFKAYTDKTGELLNILGYLYNNWISLSSYSSETDRNRSKLRTDFRAKRIKKIKLRGVALDNNSVNIPVLARMFYPLTQYINLYIFNLGFYGNRKDAGVAPFDPEFLQNLDNVTQIPVFLLTKNHCHETADVFQYYNELVYSGQLLIDIPDLFVGTKQSQGIFLPPIRPQPTVLRELYRRKRQLLREDTTDASIYDIIGKERPSTEINYFDLLMNGTKTRTLKVKFHLKDSYRNI